MTPQRILNPEQLNAVKHENGPLLIIAGAGTGKTTVITERIKYLILKKKIKPSEILALTFTEKAAREMEERVDVALPLGYSQMWISTFHAFCDRILRNEAIQVGLTPSYILMSEAESIQFLRKRIFEFKLKYFRPLGNPGKFLQGMMQHFSRLKDEDVSPKQYLQYASQLKADPNEVEKTNELAHAFETYENLKIKEGVMDFSDLISNTLLLFRTRSNVLSEYQNIFKYILVDEFQDTNFAQNQLALLLSGEQKNITVVGDDDQAIYRWRGAAISNIVQFREQFPSAKIVTLTTNYRSTQEILDTSYAVIQNNNPDRLEIKEHVNKKLVSERKIKGAEVEFLFGKRVEDEAELISRKIKELVTKRKFIYKDIAILVRANDHAQSFTRQLLRAGIPFQFLGPGRLFKQEEIKDLIAYLKVLYNFEDSTSLYRVLNNPVFGLEARDIASFLNLARRKNFSLFEALEYIADEKNNEEQTVYTFPEAKTKEKVKIVVEMIKRHLKKVPTDSAGQILYFFLSDSGLLNQFLTISSSSEDKTYQNIAKFFDKLKTYEAEHEDASVFAVVDWIDLSMQMGESPLASDTDWSENNAVNILTIHSSKGLEFPVVFLVNLVTQRFPTRERREQIPIPQELIKEILPEGDYHLQEERRLFYVGMTRARDYLFISGAHFYGEGKRERKISPFVYEVFGQEFIGKQLHTKHLQTIEQPSLLDWAPQEPSPLILPENSRPTITYISYSQINTFAICPLHYKLRYILKIPTQTTPAQSFGTSVHATLRDFYSDFMKDKSITPKHILETLKKEWITDGYESKTHERQAFEKAQHILTEYLKKHFDPKIAKPAALEVPFTIVLKDSNTHPILKVGGRIDRVDALDGTKIEIIDYKTGSNIPEEKELAQDLQLTMYGFAAHYMQNPPFNKKAEDIILSLFYLEEDVKLSTVRSLEELENCKKLIFEKVEEIEKSDFLCSRSILCQNCEYKMLCQV